MTTEIANRYFWFNPRNGAEYYALISASSKEEAIKIYYREISDRDADPDVGCKELTSAEAWKKLQNADDGEGGELSIEEKLESFEDTGIILWPMAMLY